MIDEQLAALGLELVPSGLHRRLVPVCLHMDLISDVLLV